MLQEERTLLKGALIVSLLGIIILIILAESRPEVTGRMSIDAATTGEEGSYVLIQGEIKTFKDTPTIIIITLQDESGEMKVIADKNGMDTKLQKNMAIEVGGIIKTYQGQKEVEAQQIRILKKTENE